MKIHEHSIIMHRADLLADISSLVIGSHQPLPPNVGVNQQGHSCMS